MTARDKGRKAPQKKQRDRRAWRPGSAIALAGVAVGAAALGAVLAGFRRTGTADTLRDDAGSASRQPTPAEPSADVLPTALAGDAVGAGAHVPDDLMGDQRPGAGERAAPAFRPDIDAPMSAAEREAMRPVTIGAPPRDED